MTEEIDYSPRNIEVNRYYDLTSFVSKVYQDGFVSAQEMNAMNAIKGDILYEYQIASQMLEKTNASSPVRAQLENLLLKLRRGWQLMDWASDKAGAVNQMSAEQKARLSERSHQKTKLDLTGLSASEMLLLVSALSSNSQEQVEKNEIEKELQKHPLATLSAEQKRAYEVKIVNTLAASEREALNEMQTYRLLGLERSR